MVCMCMVMVDVTNWASSGMVANVALGEFNKKNDRKNEFSPVKSPFAPENLVSLDGFGRPPPRISLLILHTQDESGFYTQDEYGCLLTRFLPFSAAASVYLFKRPFAIGSVPSLSGHAIVYRWRSLPRVRRHRASSPQGSSRNRCCHFAGRH